MNIGREIKKIGLNILRLLRWLLKQFDFISKRLYKISPKGLYVRTVMIVILPMLILVSVLGFIFMERHFETVTSHLSRSVAQNIALIIDLYEKYPNEKEWIEELAIEHYGLNARIFPSEPLPPPAPKPFFSSHDRVLSEAINQEVGKPFWIDTIGRSNFVEIRIRLQGANINITAPRSQTYSSNSHIFLLWMGGTGLALIFVALLFLRNQIKPIQQLASAAEAFGKGHSMPPLTLRGAREVRQASQSFLDMQARIERHLEQRTLMLAGVSHDLKTYLTRFRLQIELMGAQEGISELIKDTDEMQQILEDYLAFVRGNALDQRVEVDLIGSMEQFIKDFQSNSDLKIHFESHGDAHAHIRVNAIRRCFLNILQNADKFAQQINIILKNEQGMVDLTFDDDGPGIPKTEMQNVLEPFYRVDIARNLDNVGSGLGLTIARDIIRAHGGDLSLEKSPLGGLRIHFSFPAQ